MWVRAFIPVPSITQYGHSVSLVVCVGLCSTAGRGGARDQNVIYCSESQSITDSPCGTLIPYPPCLKPITNAFCARHPIECLYCVCCLLADLEKEIHVNTFLDKRGTEHNINLVNCDVSKNEERCVFFKPVKEKCSFPRCIRDP